MRNLRRIYVLTILVIVGIAALAVSQGTTGGEGQRTAEQAFKNIQSLKSVPADQVVSTMQYFSASLGVQCNFCHVAEPGWAPEKDDKEEKKTARLMIAMTQAINKDNFKGRPEVGCATCHAGRSNPRPIPPVGAERPIAPQLTAGQRPPAPDQVLDTYFTAIGGRQAVEKLNTKATRGTATLPQGKATFEIWQKSPNQILITLRPAEGQPMSQAIRGNAGWLQTAQGVTDVTGDELNLGRFSAQFQDPELTAPANSRVGIENVNGRDCYVLRKPPTDTGMAERLYFDKQSGLLVRRLIVQRTVFGPLPNVWDYSDYRDLQGVKTPFTIVRANWQAAVTFRAESIEFNLPIDDRKFEKPAALAPAGPK